MSDVDPPAIYIEIQGVYDGAAVRLDLDGTYHNLLVGTHREQAVQDWIDQHADATREDTTHA